MFAISNENLMTATLKFERQSSFVGCICRMDIYVNHLKVASVANGGRIEVNFKPAENGRNTLFVELFTPIGVTNRSIVSEFYATQGAVIAAKSVVDGWVFKLKPDINLTWVQEKPGDTPS